MKTTKSILYLSIACSILLFGCPYEAKYSLSNPAESVIDTTLNGSWDAIFVKEKEQVSGIEINTFNDHEYIVEMFIKGKGSLTIQKFRAFATILNHQNFLNIQEIGNIPKFSFYKYSVSNDTLRTASASGEYIKEQFKSRKDMASYFSRHMNDPMFFGDEQVFIKRGK